MNKKPRVSHEQKELLLEFMMKHEDLARGRVGGADGSRRKGIMLEELAVLLNAVGSGATKTPDKWLKCWQDWRSDTKTKSYKIKKYSLGSGGGPSPAPLTQLEDTLLQFCGGVEMVQGVEAVHDPLEHVESEFIAMTDKVIEANPNKTPIAEEAEASLGQDRQGRSNRLRSDPLQVTLEKQAVALEHLASGMQDLSQAINSGMQDIAEALRSVAAAIEQQPVAVVSDR